MGNNIEKIEEVLASDGFNLRKGFMSRDFEGDYCDKPFLDGEDSAKSKDVRHIVSHNTSYGFVELSGDITLRLNPRPVSMQNGRRELLDSLNSYGVLCDLLDENGFEYEHDEDLISQVAGVFRELI